MSTAQAPRGTVGRRARLAAGVVAVLLVVLAACLPGRDDPSGGATDAPPGTDRPAGAAASVSTASTQRPTASARPVVTAPVLPPAPFAFAARTVAPEAGVSVLPTASDEGAALEVSRALFARAPVVVLADVSDPAAQGAGAAVATSAGAPLLLTGPAAPAQALLDELVRLRTHWLVVEGAAVLEVPAGVVVVRPGGPATLPRTARPAPVPGVLVLTGVGAAPAAALATVAAAGVPVLDVPGGDPRSTTATVQAVAAVRPSHVVALGAAFGDPAVLGTRVAAASTGVLAPGGGQLVFPQVAGQPGKRYVALYGTPGSAALGVLGEQDVPATVARAQGQADAFRPLTTDTVVPAVELIATVASGGPEDGSYSRRIPVETLRPLVEAAGAAGLSVVLDLQPGRTDFLTQAQQYTDLLALPYVGLALDPEWRLAPDQVHLRQIGSVGIDEVNAVSAWLADLTRQHALPQKMLVLHQFAQRMILGRERLDTSHDELAIVVHVDGQGTQPAKAGTWSALRAGAPPVHWGWKNFYDEDQPMLDPAQTYAVQPVPDLVTYQ